MQLLNDQLRSLVRQYGMQTVVNELWHISVDKMQNAMLNQEDTAAVEWKRQTVSLFEARFAANSVHQLGKE